MSVLTEFFMCVFLGSASVAMIYLAMATYKLVKGMK